MSLFAQGGERRKGNGGEEPGEREKTVHVFVCMWHVHGGGVCVGEGGWLGAGDGV